MDTASGDLAAARIRHNIYGHLGIGRSHILHTERAGAVGIESRGGIIGRLQDISHADAPECLIPQFNPPANSLPPKGREERIDIKGDGTDFALFPEIDPRSEIGRTRALSDGETRIGNRNHTDSRIGDASRCRPLGEHRDRTPGQRRERHILADGEDEILRGHVIGQIADDRRIALATADVAQQGQIRLVTGPGDMQWRHAVGLEGHEVLVITHEQVGILDHDRRRVGIVGLDGIGGNNRPEGVDLQGLFDRRAAFGQHTLRNLMHANRRIAQREGDMIGRNGLLPGQSIIRHRRLLDRGMDDKLAVQQRQWNLRIDFPVDKMEFEKSVDAFVRFVLEEFFVGRQLGGRCNGLTLFSVLASLVRSLGGFGQGHGQQQGNDQQDADRGVFLAHHAVLHLSSALSRLYNR